MANRYTRKGQENPQGTPESDEFVSFWTKGYDFILPHMRSATIVASAALVAAVAIWIGTALFEHSREDATEMFGKAVQIYETSPTAEDKKPDEKTADQKPALVKPKVDSELPVFKTAKERDEAVLAEISKLQSSHGMIKIAKQAALFKAGVLYDDGRYQDAAAAYKEYAESSKKGDPSHVVALEGIGLSYEAGGKLDEALAAYKQLESSGGDFYRDRALYDEARVTGAKGDKAGAEKIYKDILAKTPASSLKEEIQNHLALLGGG